MTNDANSFPRVRLIGADGEQLGVVTADDARERAYDEGLDLVEVSATADPPVCRVMNYDKFRYEQKKKHAGSKKETDDSRDKRDQIPSENRRA